MEATWSRNKNTGKWGVRVKTEDPFEELPARGATVTVTKRSGETSEVTLGAQVWKGEDEGGYAVGLYALD